MSTIPILYLSAIHLYITIPESVSHTCIYQHYSYLPNRFASDSRTVPLSANYNEKSAILVSSRSPYTCYQYLYLPAILVPASNACSFQAILEPASSTCICHQILYLLSISYLPAVILPASISCVCQLYLAIPLSFGITCTC